MKNGNLTMGEQSPYPQYITDTFTHFRPEKASTTKELDPIGGSSTRLTINDKEVSTAIRNFSKFHPGRWIENFSRFPWYSEKYKTDNKVAYVDDLRGNQKLTQAQAETIKKRVDQLQIIIDDNSSPNSKLTATLALACYLVDYQDPERGISYSLRKALDQHATPLLAKIIINSQPEDDIWPILQNTLPLMPPSTVANLLDHLEDNMGTTQQCNNWANTCFIAAGIAQSGFATPPAIDNTTIQAIHHSALRVVFNKLPDLKSAGVDYVHPIEAFAAKKGKKPQFDQALEVIKIDSNSLAPQLTASWKDYQAYHLKSLHIDPPFSPEEITIVTKLLPNPKDIRALTQQLQLTNDPIDELTDALPDVVEKIRKTRETLQTTLNTLAPKEGETDFSNLHEFLNQASNLNQTQTELDQIIIDRLNISDGHIIEALHESGLLIVLTQKEATEAEKIKAIHDFMEQTGQDITDTTIKAVLSYIETQLQPIKATLVLQQTALNIAKTIQNSVAETLKTQVDLKVKWVAKLQNLLNSQHQEDSPLSQTKQAVFSNCGKLRKDLGVNINTLLPNLTIDELINTLGLPQDIKDLLLN